jgi:uncharacterized protein (DUF885 family)
VPAELKDGYLRTADYTRKTQEVAAAKREVEAKVADLETQATQIQAKAKLTDDELDARVAKRHFEQRLEEFQKTDWQALQAEDFVAAQSKWMEYQNLKDTYGQVNQFIAEAEQTRTQMDAQETAQRLRATEEFAKREIKGWTPEIDVKLTEFAVKGSRFYQGHADQGV